MINYRERATEAIQALGECSYSQANNWLIKKYGMKHGVTDTTYYKARSDLRKTTKMLKPLVKATTEALKAAHDELNSTATATAAKQTSSKTSSQTVERNDITVAELIRAKAVCNEFGGRQRLQRILRALGDLLGDFQV